MAVCPKCRQEYREGFTKCTECDVELVGKTPEDEDINVQEVLLINAEDEMQANLIVSLLESYNIPSLKKFRESDDYLNIYMGRTNVGVDIFVPSGAYEDAKQIIEASFNENSAQLEDGRIFDKLENTTDYQTEYYNETSQTESPDDYEKRETARRALGWLMIIVFVLPMIVGAIAYLINLF